MFMIIQHLLKNIYNFSDIRVVANQILYRSMLLMWRKTRLNIFFCCLMIYSKSNQKLRFIFLHISTQASPSLCDDFYHYIIVIVISLLPAKGLFPSANWCHFCLTSGCFNSITKSRFVALHIVLHTSYWCYIYYMGIVDDSWT